jgi:uncharacterized protein (DUF924 family)
MSEHAALPKCSVDDVLSFWLAAGPKRWFEPDDVLDAAIRERFAATYEDASAGLLTPWENSPEGAIALVIVLDQFPRNMFRGSARAYAADQFARAVAERAIAKGFDRQIEMPVRQFFYLPFEHSEAIEDQETCLALMRVAGGAEQIKWAELHADIIRRFGRFPHRNAALGRATTPEEQSFLDAGGFGG